MGVDAIMRVRTKEPLSFEQVKDLSWRLWGAFYGEPFYKEALAKQSIDEIEVNITCRFYGRGYERGPILQCLEIAEWLEYNIPNCTILYGGDCDMRVIEWTKKERKEIKEYFFKNGHHPYQSYFGKYEESVKCPTCNKPMINCGGGGGDSFVSCYGCPIQMITRGLTIVKQWDDGKDFFEMHKSNV